MPSSVDNGGEYVVVDEKIVSSIDDEAESFIFVDGNDDNGGKGVVVNDAVIFIC